MRAPYHGHTIRRMFSGLVEQAFYAEVGVCDPKLVDYLVILLLEFLHIDQLYRIRDARGRRLETIAEMLAQQAQVTGMDGGIPKRDFHRYIGDFALFWTGVFPEGLRRRRRSPNPDSLVDYVDRGRESYAIAARLFDEDSQPPGSVLRCLSTEFEVCAHGLGLVRRGWERREFRGLDDPARLLY